MTDQPPTESNSSEDPEALKQRIAELEARLGSLEGELEQQKKGRIGWKQLRSQWKSLAFLGIVLAFAMLPAILVVRERWLGLPNLKLFAIQEWCANPLLCRSGLPSYFGGIFVATLALGIVFLIWGAIQSRRDKEKADLTPESSVVNNGGVENNGDVVNKNTSTPRLRWWVWGLWIAGGGMAILSLALSLVRQDPLDWGFLLAMGLYLAGWVLQADGFRQAWHFLRRNARMLAAFLIVQVALILLLAALAGPQPFPWILLAMLALAAFLGRRGLRKIPPILWIFNLALLLYGWRINSWLFAAIGDDFAFFFAAREIALQQDLPTILGKFFDGLFVYGAHPYLSSLIQALSMKLVGVDSFGWRFSNAYLSALAIVFFYLFFKAFIGRSKALLIALLLAGSVYLLTFGKIGYNNLQAFFGMGLVLWAAGWAVRSGSQRISGQGESTNPGLAYSILGFCLGLCFYVYPAALYILPLPLLLVLSFQPLRSNLTWRGLGLTTLALLLCLLPLLLQPGYWQSKSAGLIPNNPEIVQTGQEVALHLGANFLDAFYSFLYTPQETHFVPVGYVDPLTAVLILIGLALAFQRAPRQRFSLYTLLSLLWLLIAAGVSHDRPFPPTTRMFLLLPWWAFLAVEALSWLVDQVSATRLTRWSKQGMLIVLVSLVIGLNLYQAHVLSPRRTAQYQSMETLFLGIVQRLGEFEPLRLEPLTFVFLTDQDWGIDGLHTLLQAYATPASRVNIRRLKLEQPLVAGFYDALISERDTLVIIQPTLPPEWQVDLQAQLMALGKQGCEIKEVNGRDTRFTLWHSPELAPLCEFP